jgi:acyl-CoA synthetase (AMP-forming)/AMP-acid ligase II
MASAADVPGYAAWDGTTAYPTGLAMFRAALADHPDRPLIHFGDRVLTVGEAGEKYPRIVEFRDELPKTISGKVRRNELR